MASCKSKHHSKKTHPYINLSERNDSSDPTDYQTNTFLEKSSEKSWSGIN